MCTSGFVSGDSIRPNYRLIAVHYGNDSIEIQEGLTFYNRTFRADHIPVVSIFSGSLKVAVGLVHTIAHLSATIFDRADRARHVKEAKLGAKNLGRGAVAIVPLIGNAIVLEYDVHCKGPHVTAAKFEKNKAVLYECDKKVASVSAKAYYQKLRENPAPEALLAFMKDRAFLGADKPFGGIHLTRDFFCLKRSNGQQEYHIPEVFQTIHRRSYIDFVNEELEKVT